jgi:protein TonB
MADAPADYALSAGLAVPAGPPPPGYILAVERQAGTEPVRADRTPYRAAAAAFALHLAVLLLIIMGRAPPDWGGADDVLPENVDVSVISAEELESLSASASRQKQLAAPSPIRETAAPPAPAQAVLAPPLLSAPSADWALPSWQPRADTRSGPSFDPSAFAAFAAAQFSAQVKHDVEADQAEARRRAAARRSTVSYGRVRSSRPGATHAGRSDEFGDSVIWALGATVPQGNGKWGSTVVTFTVSASGQPDGLRLLKSSGDNWLDGAALMAVKQARIPSPPPGLPTGDRTFVIEYISLPSFSR